MLKMTLNRVMLNTLKEIALPLRARFLHGDKFSQAVRRPSSHLLQFTEFVIGTRCCCHSAHRAVQYKEFFDPSTALVQYATMMYLT